MTDELLDEGAPAQPGPDDALADLERAVTAITEALLAMMTAQRRLNASDDGALQGILAQQLSREKEHLVMLLEWMRQRDPTLDEHMRAYFFQDDAAASIAAPAPAPVAPAPAPVPAPVTTEPAPITTPAKGLPLTLNPTAMRIRG